MNNKQLKILLIILLSFLSIAIIWFMVAMINNSFKFSSFNISSKMSKELVLDKIYNIDFNKIDINTSKGNIYIRESSNNEFNVVIYGDKEYTTVNTDNQVLYINVKNKNCIGFCFDNTVPKVEVYIPSNYANLIKIVSNYGDIEVGNFKEATIDIQEDFGDVSVIGGNIIKIDNEYGDIKIKEVLETKINISKGDVDIKSVYDATIDNNYGDIEIDNVYNYLNLNNDCGDIKINNVVLNKNSSIKDALGDIEIGNTNEIYIDAKTNLGDVKIRNNYPKSDITLKIDNDCGDIEIDN